MYKTTLVAAVQRTPSGKNEKPVELIIARDDEVFDPGTEYLIFSTGNDEEHFYELSVSDLLSYTSHEWIAFGIEYVSKDNRVYWIAGADYLKALQDLGFTEFDMLEEML